MTERIIALVDGNAFFASCLQATDPSLRGKPVIVAGDPKKRHGVVLAVSYEAKRVATGPVRGGMLLHEALRVLPRNVIVAPPDQNLFARISDQFYAVLERFSPVNERASVDEVYADWTGCTHLFGGDPLAMGRQVMEAIQREVGIPVSVGLGRSKITAKVAAELKKPRGLTWLRPADWVERVYPLPVGDLFGVGPKSADKLKRMGLYTIGDLANADPTTLHRRFGQYGPHMRTAARGEDTDPVTPRLPDEIKSISHATTLPRDLSRREEQRAVLLALADQVGRRLRSHGYHARTVTLQFRDTAFETTMRSRSLPTATDATSLIYETACALLDLHLPAGKSVRLLGVGVGNFGAPPAAGPRQLTLFDPPEAEVPPVKQSQVDHAMDAIRAKFGGTAIKRASQIDMQPSTGHW